jgi:hypothetical protein
METETKFNRARLWTGAADETPQTAIFPSWKEAREQAVKWLDAGGDPCYLTLEEETAPGAGGWTYVDGGDIRRDKETFVTLASAPDSKGSYAPGTRVYGPHGRDEAFRMQLERDVTAALEAARTATIEQHLAEEGDDLVLDEFMRLD